MNRGTLFVVSLICLALLGGASVHSQVVSDDFNAYNLKTSLWTLVDPRGDATLTFLGTGSDNATLSLAIPGGVEHDLWSTGNKVPRIMQPAPNTNFTVEAKFESNVTSAYQMQGIIVEQDTANLLRIEFNSDGANVRIFAASFSGGLGSPVVRLNQSLGSVTQPLILRVGRTGNTWAVSHSFDGSTWIPNGNFSHTMTVNRVGLFTGNSGGTNTPAHTAIVDYFFNSASPLSPEDSASVTDSIPPLIYSVKVVPGGGGLLVSWKTDESATGSVQYGKTLSYEGGTASHPGTNVVHEVTIPNLDAGTLYNFRITSNDNRPNNSTTTGNFVATTAGAPVITVWYGTTQTFGTVGIPQRNADVLGNVAGPFGIDSLFYTLNGGPVTELSLGPDGRLLQKLGDFKINLPYASLQSGANTVAIRAVDSVGVAVRETVTVMYIAGRAWPVPYVVDWSTVTSLSDSAQVVDGHWTTTSQGIHIIAPGYDRAIAMGDTSWTDYDVTAEFTVHKIDSTATAFTQANGGPAFGVMLRWVGHTNSPTFNPPITQPMTGYLPLGALGWYHWRNGFGKTDANRWEILGNNLILRDQDSDSSNAIRYGTRYFLKVRVNTLPGSRGYYRLKFWRAGQAEPGSWLLRGLESSADPQHGSILFVAHYTDVTIGKVTVAPLEGDVTAPLFGPIQAVAGARSAYIKWETNEPANSTVSYGTTTTYTGTVLGPEIPTKSHGLVLSGLTPNTLYHYRVTSTDSAGNTSIGADSTFTTTSLLPPSSFVGDEFNAASLDTERWKFVNPTPPGDLMYTKEATTVTLVVPGGIPHDLWTNGYQVPRLMQEVSDGDFLLQAKFNSSLGPQFQFQGVLVEQDSANLIRMDFNANGTQTRIFVATFTNGFGSPKIVADVLVGPTGVGPLLMRVQREDQTWAVSYSANGADWTTAAKFFHPLTVRNIGLFAGNAGAISPAHNAVIDYIRNDTTGIGTGIVASIKVFLQGAYSGSSETMRTTLASSVPTTQPYGAAPWAYTGSESVSALPDAIVDWVLVDLRSDTLASSMVARRAAFLKNDGLVVDLDGSSAVSFPSAVPGDYYLVVRHRNHLPVMSAAAVTLDDASALYDFTTGQSMARGADPMKALGTYYGLYTGDANGDGGVTSLDFDVFNPLFRSAATGYQAPDWNMDGKVTSLDFDQFNPNFRAAASSRVPE